MTSTADDGAVGAASLELTEDALDAAARAVPEGSPVVMVNLLRYREVADYGERAEQGAAGASGRTVYSQAYLPAFSAVAAQEGVEVAVLFYGRAHATLVGPQAEHWDDVVLVRYPDLAGFRRVVGSPAYARDADHHRLAALADWRLIATSPLDPPLLSRLCWSGAPCAAAAPPRSRSRSAPAPWPSRAPTRSSCTRPCARTRPAGGLRASGARARGRPAPGG